MIITKEINGIPKTYIQAFDIDYLNYLKIPLPMTIYLKWLHSRKDEYSFIEVDKIEIKFIKEVYNLLFDFNTNCLNIDHCLTQSINDTNKMSYNEKYYLKNIRYILNNDLIKGLSSKVKEKKIEV